ncbi:MAG: hypothetical protein IPO16_14930 [Saprospiraceae bacterium]|nr:hypothetical protein [Saprospiraceae bacterium]
MEQSNDLEQGWKDSYSMKEYRANRDKLKKLALMLPKVFEQKIRVDKIPGFYLINEGIVYKDNEPVNPCEDYLFKIVKHDLIDHSKKLRSEFMDRGMNGVMKYIEYIHSYSQVQARQYPYLYTLKTE